MSDILDRIMEIARNNGYSTVNKFALEGLGWKSSQKLQRLKDPNASPSVDMLLEIANKFEVDLNYLILGKKIAEKDSDTLEMRIAQNCVSLLRPELDEFFKINANNALILDEIKYMLKDKVNSEKS
ncbi:hypothetical protein [Flagellimonas sp.]|uniref:hypothetical protein n=1 Tax=Flagellimonas sp. TaxID=2058762 RepID=UPI003F4A3FFF